MSQKDYKTHWKKMRNKKYLGEWDLLDGEELTVTIRNVQKEEMKAHAAAKVEINPVAYFKEIEKGLVLNVTNSTMIAKLCDSPYIEDWVGQKITVYRKQGCKMPGGKKGPALRVSEKKPAPKKSERKELTPEMEKIWANAVEALKGGKTIDVIKSRYMLSQENESKLLNEAKDEK